jgi:hypothetical protein
MITPAFVIASTSGEASQIADVPLPQHHHDGESLFAANPELRTMDEWPVQYLNRSSRRTYCRTLNA